MNELDDRLARDVESLARWWSQASEETRYETLRASINGETPSLETLRIAIYLAEVEAGQVAEG